MKVIKVIVDELPESCQYCQFSIYIDRDCLGEFYYCDINTEIEWWRELPKARPDWCPLVTDERLFNEYGERLTMSLPLVPNKEGEE